jgi:uncharacterized membrane protein YraQ (UPF0718 family)
MKLSFFTDLNEPRLYILSITSSVFAIVADWLIHNWYLVLTLLVASIIPLILNIMKVRQDLHLKELETQQRIRLRQELHDINMAIKKKYNGLD